ncbi:MAG TPA: hypothetical protein VKE88_03680 [Candidatus Nanoarchaeia archaeon]|nr:hypothetical protein [Candidatus Nanoarchaeia archaeon]
MTLDELLPKDVELQQLMASKGFKELSPEDQKFCIDSIVGLSQKLGDVDAFCEGVAHYQIGEHTAKVLSQYRMQHMMYKALQEGAENGCRLVQIYPIQKYQGK